MFFNLSLFFSSLVRSASNLWSTNAYVLMSQTNHYATPTYAVIIILQNYPFLCNLVEIKNYTWFKHSHDLLSNIKAISKNDCFRLLIVN